jgi:DNA-directed RNA polymerase specialized sigma24 family protein
MNDDSALLKGARELNKDSLAAIFDTYASAIYKYALRLCRDSLEADFIVGDVFAQLLEKLVAGKGPLTNLRSYLYQIAYHLIVDRARSNHRFESLEAITDLQERLANPSIPAPGGRPRADGSSSLVNDQRLEREPAACDYLAILRRFQSSRNGSDRWQEREQRKGDSESCACEIAEVTGLPDRGKPAEVIRRTCLSLVHRLLSQERTTQRQDCLMSPSIVPWTGRRSA